LTKTQKKYALLCLALGAGIALPIYSKQVGGTKPSFEVASVKPSAPAVAPPRISGQPGGRFTATNTTLKLLMTIAYGVLDFQILGGPNWINTDRWDIEAKAEEGSIPPPTGRPDTTLGSMVQSLIEDRFQLRMHRETKEMPVYELFVAKGGVKMKLSADQTLPSFLEPGDPKPRGLIGVRRGSLEGQGVMLSSFIQVLSQQLGRSIIDKTDLKGLYDITLQWSPELVQGPGGLTEPSDNSRPSFFTAVQEQLGLRLDSAKGPVEVLIIDRAEKPAEN